MTLTNDNKHHVIFGTGPVGIAVMEELVKQGRYRRHPKSA